MYTILVADDEPVHRRGILNVIRRIRPQYDVFEARDGQEAQQLIESNPIDIVITDIKMPNIDGLQLIERVGGRIKTMKFVILSAYADFDYAKKAMTLGASEYMLKPVEERDIAETLGRIEQSIGADRSNMRERVSMEKQLSQTLPVYLEHLLTKWVGDGLTKDELAEVDSIFPNQTEFVVIVSEMNKTALPETRPSGDQSDELRLALKFHMSEALKPAGKTLSFFLSGQGNMLVTILHAQLAPTLETNKILACLSNFRSILEERYSYGIAAGISPVSGDVFQEIQSSYNKALHALRYKFYYGPQSVMLHDDIPFSPIQLPMLKFTVEDSLAGAVGRLDREQATEIIDRVCAGMTDDGYRPPLRIKEQMIYFILNQLKKSEYLLQAEQYKSLVEQTNGVLSDCEYFEELKSRMKEIVLFMIANIENRKNNKNGAIIQKCKAYIEEHFMDDIPLDFIAKKFYFSPAYFSSFFKNYTGMSFSEYLLQTRMKKARELLLETDEKVYDIAAKVGYKDQGYFTKIFKREVGAAPEEFRRNSGIRSN